MFFVLSKVLVYLVKPINWIFFAFLYAYFGKNEKWKKRSLGIGLILFFIFTNHFLFNLAARWWEVETITMDEIETPYEVGILLGGYSNFNIEPNKDRHNFNERANRFNNALELFHKGKIKKILLTGGNGSLMENAPSEATAVKQYLIINGVPDSLIIAEPRSRNTHENAVFTKDILEGQNLDQGYLLITSAWHMRRAQGCFDKQEIAYTAFSTDYFSEKIRPVPESIFFPDRSGLYRWETIIREMVGYAMYWTQGYI